MSFLTTSPEIIRQLHADRERELRLDLSARVARSAMRCCRQGVSRIQRLRTALGVHGGAR